MSSGYAPAPPGPGPTGVEVEARVVARSLPVTRAGENPRPCGWGAEPGSIAADEGFRVFEGPILGIAAPHVPPCSSDAVERLAIGSVRRITDTVLKAMQA